MATLNNKEKKKFPLDIESIKSFGFKEWYKNFSWPVPWDEFLIIEQDIKNIFNKHIQLHKNNVDIQNLFLINYKLHIEISTWLYYLLIFKAKEYHFVYNNNSNFIKNTLDHGHPVRFEASDCLIKFPPKGELKYRIIIPRIFKTYLKVNQFRPPNIFRPFKSILSESHSPYTLSYLHKESLGNIIPFSFRLLLRKLKPYLIKNDELQKIGIVIKKCISDILDYFIKKGMSVYEGHKTYLNNLFQKSFYETYKVYKTWDNYFAKRKPINLYFGFNNNMIRILTAAIKKNNGNPIGFTHGEAIIYDWDKVSWMELSLNKKFFEYNQGLANALMSRLNLHPTPNDNTCEIAFLNKYQFNLEKNKNNIHRIQSVMLIGNYYRTQSLSSTTAVIAPLQLYMEYALIKNLKSLNITVLYKKHPSTKETLPFENEVKVIKDRFENNIHLADAFLFYYTRTSTMNTALLSNKPIIIIDNNWEKICAPKEYLKNRCLFIPSNADYKNIIKQNHLNLALFKIKN